MFSFRRAPRVESFVVSFPYPLKPCPPIVVFSPYADPSKVSDLSNALTLAASMTKIRTIDPRFWAPEYPLVAFSEIDGGLLTDADRDYVWRTFGVPVFEYLLDSNGKIIARECEAHEGLHLEIDLDLGEAAVIEKPCPCNRPGPRLLSIASPIA